MSETVNVRTTMQPDRDLSVSPHEARELELQGLLADDQPRQGKPASNQTSSASGDTK